MSVLNPQKTISPSQISCQGTASVTLSFDASAKLMGSPADIVLIMDRSYSMDLTKMFNAKQAANDLIATVTNASAPEGSETIGGGTRIGIVSFGSTSTQDVQFTDNRAPFRTAIAA